MVYNRALAVSVSSEVGLGPGVSTAEKISRRSCGLISDGSGEEMDSTLRMERFRPSYAVVAYLLNTDKDVDWSSAVVHLVSLKH
jgi:hypothetical protein